jgi:hypothetical protein
MLIFFYQFSEGKQLSGEEIQDKDKSREHGKWGGGEEKRFGVLKEKS